MNIQIGDTIKLRCKNPTSPGWFQVNVSQVTEKYVSGKFFYFSEIDKKIVGGYHGLFRYKDYNLILQVPRKTFDIVYDCKPTL